MVESQKKLKTSNVFSSFIVYKNQNRSALLRELWNNNLLFVGQLYEDKYSYYVLMIWFSLQLTSEQWINTQQFTARADLFFIIASFCSLEGQFESKIESWKIRNSKTRCLAIKLIVTVSMLYQLPVDVQLIFALVFCIWINAIQFVLYISLIRSFFYINIYLSIAAQPSLCWTC